MDGLKIPQRVYVFGQGDKETLAARIAKDVCNPAIHNWTIAYLFLNWFHVFQVKVNVHHRPLSS